MAAVRAPLSFFLSFFLPSRCCCCGFKAGIPSGGTGMGGGRVGGGAERRRCAAPSALISASIGIFKRMALKSAAAPRNFHSDHPPRIPLRPPPPEHSSPPRSVRCSNWDFQKDIVKNCALSDPPGAAATWMGGRGGKSLPLPPTRSSAPSSSSPSMQNTSCNRPPLLARHFQPRNGGKKKNKN